MLSASEIGTSCGEHQREYLYKMSITKDPKAAGDIEDYQAIKANLDLYNAKGLFPGSKTGDIVVKTGGETYHVSGTDESNKAGTLTFRADEKAKIYRFWKQFKGLTGNEYNHAAHPKSECIFNMVCDQVSVDKTTITNSITLENVMVLEVSELVADKEATGISTFTVGIVWDKPLSNDFNIGKTV